MADMNTTPVHRHCPVCDGSTARPHWQKGDLRLVRCTNCAMVYADPVPPGMASGQFYDEAGKDYYLSPAKLESDYAGVRFERELRLFRDHCPTGVVLDVGCSSGAFLFRLRQRWPADYQVLGTDASGPALDYAQSRGVPVVRGNFLEQDFSTQTGTPFDAITFWATLEHLAEPRRFLARAGALLAPGGHCFVLVPNLKSLAARWLSAKYRYVYPQHLNYFSATTLNGLSERAGFQVVARRFTHFNPVVIWQDWRGRGREISNAERGALLKQTTALKQKPWLRPVKWLYDVTEKFLGSVGLADNVALVLRKPH